MDDHSFETLKAQYEHPQPTKGPHRRLIAIILSIVGVLIIAGIAFAVLTIFTPKTAKTPSSTQTAQTTGPSAVDTIAKIIAVPSIANEQNYWQYHLSSAQTKTNVNTTLVYADTNYPFVTNVIADDGIQFTLKDKTAASDKAAITNTIEQTLTAAGFSKVAQTTTSFQSYPTTTYANGGTICQLIDYKGILPLAEQSILCATHATIDASYKNAQALLTGADSSIAAQAKVIVQSTVTANPKKLLAMTVQTSDTKKATLYYFGALTSAYEYLGSQPVIQVDDVSNAGPSAALKKSVADPKWGTFLTDNIQLS